MLSKLPGQQPDLYQPYIKYVYLLLRRLLVYTHPLIEIAARIDASAEGASPELRRIFGQGWRLYRAYGDLGF